jgi:hypothetical protein
MAWSYLITIYNESNGRFPKSLYAIKNEILSGKTKLDVEKYRVFDLLENGSVVGVIKRSVFEIEADTSARIADSERHLNER